MLDKKRFYYPLVVLNLIGLVLGFLGGAYVVIIAKVGFFLKISSFLVMLAVIASIVYLFKGYKKDAARYFKIFMLLFAAAQLAAILNMFTLLVTSPVKIVFHCIAFIFLVLLAVGKDLGKTVSFILCGAVFVWFLIVLIDLIATASGNFSSGSVDAALLIMRGGSDLCLAAITGLMTYAKYMDKASRGK